MASYFLGSDGAPTTAEVLEERLATFGHAEETAALMGDDHESTVAPHPDGAHGVATRAPTHVARVAPTLQSGRNIHAYSGSTRVS